MQRDAGVLLHAATFEPSLGPSSALEFLLKPLQPRGSGKRRAEQARETAAVVGVRKGGVAGGVGCRSFESARLFSSAYRGAAEEVGWGRREQEGVGGGGGCRAEGGFCTARKYRLSYSFEGAENRYAVPFARALREIPMLAYFLSPRSLLIFSRRIQRGSFVGLVHGPASSARVEEEDKGRGKGASKVSLTARRFPHAVGERATEGC